MRRTERFAIYGYIWDTSHTDHLRSCYDGEEYETEEEAEEVMKVAQKQYPGVEFVILRTDYWEDV